MRYVLAALLLAPVGLGVAQAQKDSAKKETKVAIGVDFSVFEKAHGLKIKNAQVTDNGFSHLELKFVAEFERDLQPAEVTTLKSAFSRNDGGKRDEKPLRYQVVFLDPDNVALTFYELHNAEIKGEISGVKGEAFRGTLLGIDKRRTEGAKKAIVRDPAKKTTNAGGDKKP